jgi:hypothetical protein
MYSTNLASRVSSATVAAAAAAAAATVVAASPTYVSLRTFVHALRSPTTLSFFLVRYTAQKEGAFFFC